MTEQDPADSTSGGETGTGVSVLGDLATDAGDYSAVYYHSYNGPPYTYDEPHWKNFFGAIAESLVALFGPATSYDAGCAKGFLVRELASRGVDARGGDISASAIADAPPGLAERLEVRDLTHPFDERYDLISCIEVLEHMSAHDARLAIANICAATDLVLLSSTPDGYAEPTHVNVRQPAAWAQDFAVHGFFRRTDVDASFLSPWAVMLQRTEVTTAELATRYEGYVAALSREVLEKRRALLDAQRLVDEQSAPALQESASLRAQAEGLHAEIAGLNGEIARLHTQEIAGLHAEIARLRSADVLADNAAKLAVLDEVIGLRAELAEAKVEQDAYAEPLRQELADARASIETLTAQLATARAEIGTRPAGGAFGASRTVTEAVAAKEAEMKGSRTWRIGRMVLGPAVALKRVVRR